MSHTAPPHFPTSLIRLTTKPTAQLSYTFIPASPASLPNTSLLVFLNGLGLPQASWTPVLLGLKSTLQPRSAMLTYDRYGQGLTTDRDPTDLNSPDPTHAHDAMSAVADLRQLILQIAELKLGVPKSDARAKLGVVFVCNSIGCAIARLYAKEFPGAVQGVVFLDSIVANAEYMDMFPNPDAEDFDEGALPEAVTAQMVRDARHNVGMKFGTNVGSVEGLSRMNLASLLPYADAPNLVGPGGKGPWVSVVGHDFERFAEDSESMGVPAVLSRLYMNPKWNAYNEGLAKITDAGRGKGPVQAPGAGHFIQRDNPDFVVEEVAELLRKIQA